MASTPATGLPAATPLRHQELSLLPALGDDVSELVTRVRVRCALEVTSLGKETERKGKAEDAGRACFYTSRQLNDKQ